MDAEARGDLTHAGTGGSRVGTAHVGDDADAACSRAWQHRCHPLVEAGIEAGVRIGPSGLLGDGDRPLREAFEYEDVEIAALDQLDRGLDAIAGVARAAADADRARAWSARARRAKVTHSAKTPKSTAAAVITSVAAKRSGPVKR